jgi:pimeloyl-ACP methyl ester carboxylesterase
MTATLRSRLSASESSLEFEGIRLAYSDQGQGMTLVCLHAIGHGSRDFLAVREALKNSHRVITLDWPGHGLSDDDTEDASAARYAQLLTAFLEHLKLEHVVLLGNSIGGAAAIRCAANLPDRVVALILADPAGLDRVDWLSKAMIRLMVGFFAAGVRQARWFPAAFAAYYHLVLPSPAAREERSRLVASAYEIAAVLEQAWRSFGRAQADLRPLIPKIEQPVLFTWAVSDRIVQLGRNLDSIRQFRHARLVRFPGGHSPFLEAPAEFLEATRPFLASLELANRSES